MCYDLQVEVFSTDFCIEIRNGLLFFWEPAMSVAHGRTSLIQINKMVQKLHIGVLCVEIKPFSWHLLLNDVICCFTIQLEHIV